MRNLLLVLVLSPSLHAQTREPVPPPQALCTPKVDAAECKQITALLAFRQLGSAIIQNVQFVIADNTAFTDEEHRVETMQANTIANAPKNSRQQERALVAPNFLSMPSGILLELDEANHLHITKVYFNETLSCHDESRDVNVYKCAGGIEYAMGFIEGMILGSNNVINFTLAGH